MRRRVRQHEADILITYGKSLKGDHITPEQANSFLESFIKNGRKNLKEVRELEEQIVELDRKIAKQREQQQERVGSTDGKVVVTISASTAGPVDLKLTYSKCCCTDSK
jgi:cell division septum initiation protein DivIVA